MKKYLAVVVASCLLAACGGSDSGSDSSTQAADGHDNKDTTIKDTTTNNGGVADDSSTQPIARGLSDLIIGDVKLGNTLMLTTNSTAKQHDFKQQLLSKPYYGRYAYCLDDNCLRINVGQVKFNFSTDNAGNLSVENINVNMFGRITLQNTDGVYTPTYQSLATGKVNLAQSKLTPISNGNAKQHIYNLSLMTASSTEQKIPNQGDIDLYFSDDAMHVAGADDEYVLVAQQFDNQPEGWDSPASKSDVAGKWQAVEIDDDSLTVIDKLTIKLSNQDIIQQASALSAKSARGNKIYNGYYKNLGAGFVFGYTDDNQPLRSDGANYDSIEGLIVLAPNNKFGVGYNSEEDHSFLLFK